MLVEMFLLLKNRLLRSQSVAESFNLSGFFPDLLLVFRLWLDTDYYFLAEIMLESLQGMCDFIVYIN
jgi:hypothetical protein